VSTLARWTLDDYDRMIQAGVFARHEDRRIEFVRGEIREMTPLGSLHEEVLERLTEWSYEHVPKRQVRVRVQNSFGLPGLESAPQPDLAWVVRRDYSTGRPSAEDVLLLIEVAESSLVYDTGEKADLYAAAGIADYWVVDLIARVVEVRRDALEGRYRTLQTYRAEAEVHPLRFPALALRPALLWAPGIHPPTPS